MKRAYLGIRTQPHYRHEAFAAGLARIGYKVNDYQPAAPAGPHDLLVIWNRYGDREATADLWEKKGGTVLVAENGYLGADAAGVQTYALAIHGHNGSGRWPAGDGTRWEALASRCGIEVMPWRAPREEGHLYIRGQRGFGPRPMASPPNWHEETARSLKKRSKRRLQIVPHPGRPSNSPEEIVALERDLAGAHACLIWCSSAGVRALVRGVPVFFSAPHWICAVGGVHNSGSLIDVERPVMDDARRLAALQRMAWAQWTVAELESGEPFARLVELAFGAEAVPA